MKKCPVCETTYPDSVNLCEVDESILLELPPAKDPYIGQTLKGRFRVLDKLGEGGMGALYLADQVSNRKIVALKIVSPQYANDPDFVDTFQGEARLASSVSHPNIVSIYDIDRFTDGSLFIAMEYLQGRELREVIKQERPLDIGKAVRYAIQIAEGLEAAHRAGVIHRGIKPQSIMVLSSGDTIKLMDFGIARGMEASSSQAAHPSFATGTPEYISPEQVNRAQTSEQTDIYAFGVVFYEMLTGTVPFSAPTPAAVLAKQGNEMPQPVRTLRREIPTSLEQLVMQALEKKAEDRQRNMGEIVHELKSAAALLENRHSPKTLVNAPRNAATGLATAFAKWKKVGVAAAVVLLALGGIYYWFETEREPVAPSPATSTSAPRQSDNEKIEAQKREQAAEKERQGRMQEESAKQAAQRAEETERRLAEEKSRAAAEQAQSAKDERQAKIDKEKAERELARRPAEKTEKLRKAEAERIAREQAKQRQAEERAENLARVATLSAADLTRMRNQIDQKLKNNGLSGLSIEVSSAGVVTLSGTLRDQKLKGEVSRLVGEVPGVAEVRQNVQIGLPDRDDQSVEIRAQIEQRLRNSGLLKVSDSDRWGLTVNIASGGIVTLTGVLRDQKLRFEAVRLTREVPGVSDVRQNIRVVGNE